MKAQIITVLALASLAGAQESPSFEDASSTIQERLDASVAELNALREQLAEEKIPLSRELQTLESELLDVRAEFQRTTRILDSRIGDLSKLTGKLEMHRDQASYVSNLLSDYTREFESRLHIAEVARYEDVLQAAIMAPESSNLSQEEVYAAQLALVEASLGRLDDVLGGSRFEGQAIDADGLLTDGMFVMLGPAAIFRSNDGETVGSAMQRVNSNEPSAVPFATPDDVAAASALVETGEGRLPFDATLGNAHKIEATHESFVEHVKKGGLVMIPIFALAGLALLVALFKLVVLLTQPMPSQRQLDGLLDTVGAGDEAAARQAVGALKGPLGRMLAAGVEHLREPRELIEEVMYETVLKTRLKLQSFLPFIAICAASAPLLGLLGTVTGIINTFKMITVFGSGDVKSLSGGISEALITTKFGLIVAIPSLLLHAFLFRRAKGVVDRMEKAGLAFANRVDMTPFGRASRSQKVIEAAAPAAPDPDVVRGQVSEILTDLLGPLVEEGSNDRPTTRKTAPSGGSA